MRILILTPRLPWPPHDGGRVAMARLAESLAACGADVEILSLNPRKHRGAPHGPLPIRAVDIDTSRVVGPALRAMTTDLPFIVARFGSRDFRLAISESLRRFVPDIVQIESPFLLPFVSSIRAESKARIVLRSLNVEFRIWEGLAALARNPLRRLALRCVAAALRAYELNEMESVDAIIPISASDHDDFRSLGVTRPMHIVPCGVRLLEGGSIEPASGSVAFIGSLDYLPNQDAVRWILDQLWPRVTLRVSNATLSIAGSSSPAWMRRRAAKRGVNLLGAVENAETFLRANSVVIAPLFAGGGMRIKVLEAMALGKPIVATTIGAGGIEAVHGRDILIADDVDSFADAVVRLLGDRATAARLGAAARVTVAQRYDSRLLAAGLLRFYESL
jgi:glycosyltransferase involved in cell wall biosynthesis